MWQGDRKGELTFLEGALILDNRLAHLELVTSALAIGLEGPALVGQEDTPAPAVEEGDLELVFQITDGLADGGLADLKSLSCLGHVFIFGYFEEVRELVVKDKIAS